MHVELSRRFVGGPHIHGRSSWEGVQGTGGVDSVGGWEIIGQLGQSNASLLLRLSTSRPQSPPTMGVQVQDGGRASCSSKYLLPLLNEVCFRALAHECWSALPEQPTPCPVSMWGPEAEVWRFHPHWPLSFRKPNTVPHPLAHCWTGQGSADLQVLQAGTMGERLAVLPEVTGQWGVGFPAMARGPLFIMSSVLRSNFYTIKFTPFKHIVQRVRQMCMFM